MQLQVVVGRDSLFARFLNECYTDLDFEFTPSVNERKDSMSRLFNIVLTLFLILRMGVSQCLDTHLVPISMQTSGTDILLVGFGYVSCNLKVTRLIK